MSMPLDQLTRRERVRLESLNMAFRMPTTTTAIEDPVKAHDALCQAIFRRAEEVEKWLLAAEHSGH